MSHRRYRNKASSNRKVLLAVCILGLIGIVSLISYNAYATMQYYDTDASKNNGNTTIYTNAEKPDQNNIQGLENSIHYKPNDVNGITFPGLQIEADIQCKSDKWDTETQKGTYYASAAKSDSLEHDFEQNDLDLNGWPTTKNTDKSNADWQGMTYALGFGIVEGNRPGTKGSIAYSVGLVQKNITLIDGGKAAMSWAGSVDEVAPEGQLGKVLGSKNLYVDGLQLKLTGEIAKHFDIVYDLHGGFTDDGKTWKDEYSGKDGANGIGTDKNNGWELPSNGDRTYLSKSKTDSIRVSLIPKMHTVTFIDGKTKQTISTVKTQYGNTVTTPDAPTHDGYYFTGWSYQTKGDSTTMNTGSESTNESAMSKPTVRVENDTVLVAFYGSNNKFDGAQWTPTVTKVLQQDGKNQSMTAGQFSFQLKEGNNVIQTVANNADGKATFNTIHYKEDGEHHYTISEVKGDDDSIVYDSHVENITVKITHNDQNVYSADVQTDADGLVFTNTKLSPVSWTPNVKKELVDGATGNPVSITDGQFSFQLKELWTGKVLQTATNDADGNINFQPISYDKEGNYYYEISEIEGTDKSIKYDTSKHTIDINVIKNQDKYEVHVYAYAHAENEHGVADARFPMDSFSLKNIKRTKASWTPEATKKLEDGTLADGQFSFQLKDSSGKVLQTKKNAADGKVSFDPIEYDADGTYTYTISEVNDNQRNIVYDSHEEKITVTVTHDDTKFIANATTDGDISFDNKQATDKIPQKTVDNEKPRVNTDVVWTVSQQVGVYGQGEPAKYSSFSFSDPLPQGIAYKSAKMVQKLSDGTEKDITADAGTLKYDDALRTVSYEFSKDWLQNTMPLNGETYQLEITTSVDNDSANKTIENKATVAIDGRSKDATASIIPWTVTPPVKTVNPSDGTPVDRGQSITYTVSWKNDTGDTRKAVLEDIVPAHTTYVDSSLKASDGGNAQYDSKTGKVTASFDSVAADAEISMSFTVHVNADAVSMQDIRNKADILVDDSPSVDSNTVENPTIYRIPGDKVTVYKSSNPVSGSVVKAGDKIEYKLTAKNTGEKESRYTRIRDYVPEGSTIVKDSINNGGILVDGDKPYVEWVLDSIPVNGSKDVSFAVTVNDDAAKNGERIVNQALYETSENKQTPGDKNNPDPKDNTNDTVHLTNPDDKVPGEVQVIKSSQPTSGTLVKPGDTISYSLDVFMEGGENAEGVKNVIVRDYIPDNASYVADSVSSDNSGSFNDSKKYVEWMIPSLKVGQHVTLSFSVKVNDDAQDCSLVLNQALYESEWTDETGRDPKDSSNKVAVIVSVPETPEPPVPEEPQAPAIVKTGDALTGIGVSAAAIAAAAGIVEMRKKKH